MSKLPAFQFYPGDWRKDPAVQSLSYYHRGIWFEMMCFMFESPVRGKLLLRQNPSKSSVLLPTNLQLARLLGLTETETKDALDIILESGAASICTETGAFMCRRMVQDEHLRNVRSASGRKGGVARFAKAKFKQNTEDEDEDEVHKKRDTKGKARPKDEAEVVQFCVSLSLPESDGRSYWNKWQGNGFRNGGSAIKDWRSTIRHHKEAGYCPSQKNGANKHNTETGRGLGTANEGLSSQYEGVGRVRRFSNVQ